MASGTKTLIFTHEITDQKFQAGYTGIYTYVGAGGTITNSAIGTFQMDTLATGSSESCGCDNH